ncbi:MAG TPA: type II toxin-antitoxin system VapC family toxin [Candidatus Nanoarchaeia archaeon]|nr:type II toxin-antitoxin system VapC family toxin [Candidatus Nanoarchaeia archaeon]
MKVLDSDFIIELLKKNPDVGLKLDELAESTEQVVTTVLNAHEVLFGTIHGSQKNVTITERFFASIGVLNYDFKAMRETLNIIKILEQEGQRIGYFDEMIAGICRANDTTIITRNVKHFGKVPNLKIETW